MVIKQHFYTHVSDDGVTRMMAAWDSRREAIKLTPLENGWAFEMRLNCPVKTIVENSYYPDGELKETLYLPGEETL